MPQTWRMARDDDEDAPWTRQLLVGLGVLVAVALVIGGVVSVVALGAAKVTGVGGAKPTATRRRASTSPAASPPSRPAAPPRPRGVRLGVRGPLGTPSKKPPKEKKSTIAPAGLPAAGRARAADHPQRGLQARARAPSLQVQRFEGGGWTDFPVSAPVSGGQFTTYITTSRSGATPVPGVRPGRRQAVQPGPRPDRLTAGPRFQDPGCSPPVR